MERNPETALVTGNRGFIGTYLSRRFSETGRKVSGLDILKGRDGDLVWRQINGNILDRDAVQLALQGVDCIVHLAAEHKDFGISDAQYFRVNVKGTESLLQCAAENNVKTFVFMSSVAVYGDQQSTSEGLPVQPVTPYGESKAEAERLVVRWAQENPARRGIIIRPTVVFGAGNRANIFRLIKQVCDKRFVWVGKGDMIKSIAYVENLAEAVIFLLDKAHSGLEVFNYADSPHLTTKQLVNLVAEKAGVTVPPYHVPIGLAVALSKGLGLIGAITGHDFPITPARMKKFNTPTFHRADKIITAGFSPPFSLEEGMERNVRWYLSEGRNQVEADNTSE